VSAEYVAVSLDARSVGGYGCRADRERWQAHWIDDGPEEKLVFYCPECAEREFG
jgi:hypothetical protein